MDNSTLTDKQQIEKLNWLLARQKERLTEDYKMISGLSSGYDELHTFNLETGEYTPYFVESMDQGVRPLMAEYPDFFSAHAASMKAYCHPDFLERMLKYSDPEYLKEKLRDKKKHYERILIKRGSDSYEWNDFVLLKLDPPSKEPVNIAAGYINVDQMVKSEQERIQAMETARLARESQSERYNFLVNVAHELRTPLTLIIGPLRRIIKNEPMSDGAKASLGRVVMQAQRMTELLNTVLTTNKLEEGADSVRPVPVEFNKWIGSVADEFRDEGKNHDVSIATRLDPTIGMVDMDEHLIKIVFSNLMMNAMRHTLPGTTIEVITEWNTAGNAVRTSVKDAGSGIGDIDVSKLFERYYRATEEKTGFGIGLSYAKTLVEAHKGSIGAYNNNNNNNNDCGATFWFELPAQMDQAAQKAKTAEPEPQAAPAPEYLDPHSLRSKVLLYAEDNHDLREYVQLELADVCKKVITCVNGKKALEAMSTTHVDVVLTDVMMPEMDGLELCYTIKTSERFRHIPVVMLSARADSESIKKGYESMADYYLDKPFEVEKLIDILEKTL